MSGSKRSKVRETVWSMIIVFFVVFFLLMAILGEICEIVLRAMRGRK